MKTGPHRFLALLLAGAVLGACARDRDTDAADSGARTGSPAEVTYAPVLGVDLDAMTRTDSGLYYRDVEVGDGPEARAGDVVTVHYTGWLPEGREFDSSRSGEPFVFALGRGDVIRGWDEGVAGMRVGGRRTLVLPADLAYGTRGAGGVIPPNAVLVFDVELLGVDSGAGAQ